MDASKLGTTIKEGKNKKTQLSQQEEILIVDTFSKNVAIEDFSVVVTYEKIKGKNYNFNAGLYFDLKIRYEEITRVEFNRKISGIHENLEKLFAESKSVEKKIIETLDGLKYDK